MSVAGYLLVSRPGDIENVSFPSEVARASLWIFSIKAPTRSFHKYGLFAKIPVGPGPENVDFDGVPHSPRRQLEDTTSATDDEELLGYKQTAAQEASPEVQAGPPPSHARARDCLLAGSARPTGMQSLALRLSTLPRDGALIFTPPSA